MNTGLNTFYNLPVIGIYLMKNILINHFAGEIPSFMEWRRALTDLLAG